MDRRAFPVHGTVSARLQVVSCPDSKRAGSILPLESEPVTLGRDPGSDFTCADPGLSRHHAVVRPGSEGWEVVDEGSGNGTWCDGRRVSRHRLTPGQTIQVGATVLVFEETVGAGDASPRAGRGVLPWVLALALSVVLLAVLLGAVGWVAMRTARAGREETSAAVRAATAFRRQAAHDPGRALASLALPDAARAYRELDAALWPITKPAVGWAWFFSTSLVCVGEPAAGGTVVGFYNPWADVFLIGLWRLDQQRGARLAEAEVVLGEYVRRRGKPPFDADPLWMRRDEYRPAAVGLATAETLRAFEAVFRPRLSRFSPIRRPWRAALPGLDDPGHLAANRYAAGLVLAGTLAALAPLVDRAESGPDSVRACLARAFQEVRREGVTALVKGAGETPPESIRALRALRPDDLTGWKPAAFLPGSTRSVLLLADAERPDLFLGLLITTRSGASQIARVDLLSFQGFYAAVVAEPEARR